MKKLLLASTALVMSAGVAAADVSLSGDARMGIMYNGALASNKASFTSRARVMFTLSGETDGGLAFGASFRAHQAAGANAGTNGSVFVSGDFGRLSMGDVDGAAQFVIGHVDGVGLTGLGDHNETFYLGNNTDLSPGGYQASRPTARYDYSMDGFTFAVSHTNPGNTDTTAAVGIGYKMDGYSVGIGYESLRWPGINANQVVLGVSAEFEGITAKANYGRVNSGFGSAKRDQYQLSLAGTFDATTVTAFYARNLGGAKSAGVGASYDLGGGASIVGGIVRTNTRPVGAGSEWNPKTGTPTAARTIADFGLSFSF
ncbi:MAG: porin [Natronohydrobacter sp.]|nr:porin [Natronohydrobacter sp.]